MPHFRLGLRNFAQRNTMEKNDEYVLENYCLWLDNNLWHHLSMTFLIGCTANINHFSSCTMKPQPSPPQTITASKQNRVDVNWFGLDLCSLAGKQRDVWQTVILWLCLSKIYLGSTSKRNLECKEVSHQTL